MDLPDPLAWLIDDASVSVGPERFLADLGARLRAAAGLPLTGGALTLPVRHPIIARRTWMWRASNATVVEMLGFGAGDALTVEGWLGKLGSVHTSTIGHAPGAMLGWAADRPFAAAEKAVLVDVARFAAVPLAALSAGATLTSLLEAYLGQRSASRVEAGAFRRGTGETIRAALLVADLRDFTELSERVEPTEVIATLDAWFDRIAAAVHAFGGEVLKFIGDGVFAIFPVTDTPGDACERALRAIAAARAGMAHLNKERDVRHLRPVMFGAALHFGDVVWGNIGASGRLDFTAIGPAVNLVSRLEGLCKPLGQSVLLSGEAAAHAGVPLVALGDFDLRGVASPCPVFTVADG